MSHFSVIVALPSGTGLDTVEDVLVEVMEPWSESRAVEPYRDYEEGDPAEHWTVSLARRDTEWAERLGDNPTWETIVELHNERYPEYDPLEYDAETDRAYVVSDYNPDSKWDYWRIGGRWSGYFHTKPGAIVIPAVSSNGEVIENWCNGGPIASLDLASTRASAAADAELRYQKWEALSAPHPAAKPWPHFYDLVEQGVSTIAEARQAYNAQPLIAATHNSEFRPGCPVSEFTPIRDEYVADAVRGAVPGYALVTLDREWIAPGDMGLFGVSSDNSDERYAYQLRANDYIDRLDPATVLVVVDCHI